MFCYCFHMVQGVEATAINIEVGKTSSTASFLFPSEMYLFRDLKVNSEEM